MPPSRPPLPLWQLLRVPQFRRDAGHRVVALRMLLGDYFTHNFNVNVNDKRQR